MMSDDENVENSFTSFITLRFADDENTHLSVQVKDLVSMFHMCRQTCSNK